MPWQCCNKYLAHIASHTAGPCIRCCASKKSRLNICKTNRAHFERSTQIWACVFDLWFLCRLYSVGVIQRSNKKKQRIDLNVTWKCVMNAWYIRTHIVSFYACYIDLLITAKFSRKSLNDIQTAWKSLESYEKKTMALQFKWIWVNSVITSHALSLFVRFICVHMSHACYLNSH